METTDCEISQREEDYWDDAVALYFAEWRYLANFQKMVRCGECSDRCIPQITKELTNAKTRFLLGRHSSSSKLLVCYVPLGCDNDEDGGSKSYLGVCTLLDAVGQCGGELYWSYLP